MDPTTDIQHEIPVSVEAFYDALAPDYDLMTGFHNRFVREKPFFKLLVEKYDIASAVDAGCGTGFHSLLMAQLGVAMTAVDVSAEMIRAVDRHARELKLNVRTVQTDFGNLRDALPGGYDAVLSMGNSITHLLSDEEVRAAFDSFAAILKPRGILFLQTLNYDRILEQRGRIQSVKEAGTKTFVRFYDYSEELVSFNILTIDRTQDHPVQSMQSVQLRPLRSDEVVGKLQASGFTEIKLFGGISMEEFDPATSKDLVVLGRKLPDARNC